MFCNKRHVNQLTALLKIHGIRHVVVCPGSRNGIIVHNVIEAGVFSVHPVTDERSAAFIALGICAATEESVALCLTSGSALLNAAPAVAEAYYRQLPLLVISADRPQEWIGHLDGQTLPQRDALVPYAVAFHISEAKTEIADHRNVGIMNEALLSLKRVGGGPVHLNIAIEEPLFEFTTENLPVVSRIDEMELNILDNSIPQDLKCLIEKAVLPVVVVGQLTISQSRLLDSLTERFPHVLFLSDILSNLKAAAPLPLVISILKRLQVEPDFVVHLGGNTVDKSVKTWLRNSCNVKVVRLENGKDFPDTFSHLHYFARCKNPIAILEKLLPLFPVNGGNQIKKAISHSHTLLKRFAASGFSDLGVMGRICDFIADKDVEAIHLANSMPVRNAAHFLYRSFVPRFCNRGVNGIEGSLSAAVGHQLAFPNGKVLALLGDLSFFYDSNALWRNFELKNLKVIVFNNGGGQIFRHLPGLNDSLVAKNQISGKHSTSAKGIAEAYHAIYFPVRNYDELSISSTSFWESNDAPCVMEIFTDVEANDRDQEKMELIYSSSVEEMIQLVHKNN